MSSTESKMNLHEQWRELARLLECERDRILAEIRAYPPPIPACDEQFNHLLAQRDSIWKELKRWRAAPKETLAELQEFVRFSEHLAQETPR